MTTIAIYKGWLAADSRSSDENEVLDDTCQKISMDRDDGLIITGAGEGPPLERFMYGRWDDIEWPKNGSPILTKKQLKPLKHCDVWVYRPGDKHFYQSTDMGFEPIPTNGLPQAIGSGATYFKGAIDALLSVKAAGNLQLSDRSMINLAMQSAINIDMYSGGKINIIKLK